MAPSHDSSLIAEFEAGINAHDINRVRAALDAGVDPATPVNRLHPLVWLLMASYDTFVADAQELSVPADKIPSAEEFARQRSEIVDLLLDRGINLIKNEPYTRNFRYVADMCLNSEYREDLAKVVIETISQSIEKKVTPYQPDTLAYVGNYVRKMQQSGGDPATLAGEALKILESVHADVHKRFENPQTSVEKDLAEHHSDAIGYWQQAFERPPAEVLVAGQKAVAVQPAPAAPVNTVSGNGLMQVVGAQIQDIPTQTPAQVLADINKLVGQEEAKSEIKSLVFRRQFDTVRSKNNLKPLSPVLNTVFEGGPGSGKTTFARKQADLMHALGLAGKGKYIEINTENMMSLFPGGNGQMVVSTFDQANIIFLDDVFSIFTNKVAGNAGQILVDLLTRAIEKRQGDLTVFFSGEKKQLDAFFELNPVLKSNITHYNSLPDYTVEQLGEIMDRQLEAADLKMTPEAHEAALEKLEQHASSNTRSIRSLLKQLPDKMSVRIFKETAEEMTAKGAELEAGDVSSAAKKKVTLVTKEDVDAVQIRTTAASPKSIGFGAGAIKAPRRGR
jgi:hypothetical protein